jgi:hypothetical protein
MREPPRENAMAGARGALRFALTESQERPDNRASGPKQAAHLQRRASMDNALSHKIDETPGEASAAREKTTQAELDCALWEAVLCCDPKETRKALAKGANPKSRNERGHTTLMWAAFSGSETIVKELIPLSDIEAVDDGGTTAIGWAGRSKNPAVVAALLLAGADAKAVNRNGKTALMLAADKGIFEVVALLAPVSDVWRKDWKGWAAADFVHEESPDGEQLGELFAIERAKAERAALLEEADEAQAAPGGAAERAASQSAAAARRPLAL